MRLTLSIKLLRALETVRPGTARPGTVQPNTLQTGGADLARRLFQALRDAGAGLGALVHRAATGLLRGKSRPELPEPDSAGSSSVALRVAALAAPVLSIGLGVLAGTRGWFGPAIVELSDQQNSGILIQPANGAFAIWGLIYSGLLGLAVWQASPSAATQPHLARARLPLIVNMGFNFAWFVVTQQQKVALSVAVLVGQFLTALWLYLALNLPHFRGEGIGALLRRSVSVYLGWLTVATVISVAFLLETLGFGGLGLSAQTWALLMLPVCAGTGLLGRFAWRDRVYGAVFVWAFAGVAVKAGQPERVVVTAWLLAGVVLASLVFGDHVGKEAGTAAEGAA